MPDSLNIRALTPADRPEWTRLWTDYLAFYETTLPQEVFDTTFQRLCSDDHPEQNAFLALRGDQPVGLVHYIFHPHNWRPEGVCYLQDLYADPSVRGLGVGRALIQATYDAADAQGIPSVYWLTQEFNAQARQLYDRIAHKSVFVHYTR